MQVSTTVTVELIEEDLVFSVCVDWTLEIYLSALGRLIICRKTLLNDLLEVEVLRNYVERIILQLRVVHQVVQKHLSHLRLRLYFFKL